MPEKHTDKKSIPCKYFAKGAAETETTARIIQSAGSNALATVTTSIRPLRRNEAGEGAGRKEIPCTALCKECSDGEHAGQAHRQSL